MTGVAMTLRQANGTSINVAYEVHSGETLTELLEETIRLGAIIESIEVA